MIDMYRMCPPDIFAGPAEAFGIIGGAQPELLKTEGFFVQSFGKMGVQPHIIGTGKGGTFTHQIRGNGKGGAGSHADPYHAKTVRLMPLLNGALGFF